MLVFAVFKLFALVTGIGARFHSLAASIVKLSRAHFSFSLSFHYPLGYLTSPTFVGYVF